MADLLHDIGHVELLGDDQVAVESLSLGGRVTDVLDYYFTRFSRNLKDVFKNFSAAEITDVNERHKRAISQLLWKTDFNETVNTLIPIPKGMVGGYDGTLGELITILAHAGYDTIKLDVLNVEAAVCRDTPLGAAINSYSRDQFLRAKKQLGSLFTTKGLTHDLVKNRFKNMADVNSTNTRLLGIVKHYPDILTIHDSLKKIEKHHATENWSESDRKVITPLFLTLGYRLSIIAVTMEHIQALEHQFSQTLKLLVNHH